MSKSVVSTGGILRLATTNDFVGPSQVRILLLLDCDTFSELYSSSSKEE